MRHNYKFHGIAIACICAVVTLIYFLTAPKTVVPVSPELQGDRYIQIYSATWGADCNSSIEQANAQLQTAPPEKDKNGNGIVKKPVELVKPDNALAAVSKLCNGRLTCELKPDSDLLGIEPLASCYKKLELRYRCFAYDRLWSMSVDQGKPVKIDCNPNAAPSGKTPPPDAK